MLCRFLWILSVNTGLARLKCHEGVPMVALCACSHEKENINLKFVLL